MSAAPGRFDLQSDFELAATSPPFACRGLKRGDRAQVLLGVTGSGKTFTMAQVLSHVNRPALVMVHNKTLAAQLYQEFRRFFPRNAVEFFVSYYDYYQPGLPPSTDSYIEKEAIINDEIDRLRLSGHALALRAPRRHHRRQRVVHLRAGIARGLLRPDRRTRAAAAHRSRSDSAQAGRDSVRTQRP
jgi:excinuclease UvrABC helicase subunit UvrB